MNDTDDTWPAIEEAIEAMWAAHQRATRTTSVEGDAVEVPTSRDTSIENSDQVEEGGGDGVGTPDRLSARIPCKRESSLRVKHGVMVVMGGKWVKGKMLIPVPADFGPGELMFVSFNGCPSKRRPDTFGLRVQVRHRIDQPAIRGLNEAETQIVRTMRRANAKYAEKRFDWNLQRLGQLTHIPADELRVIIPHLVRKKVMRVLPPKPLDKPRKNATMHFVLTEDGTATLSTITPTILPPRT